MTIAKRPDQTIGILGESFINCWIPIAQTTLVASAGTFSFATIPQNFRHLFLILGVRSDVAAEVDGVILQFNADTGANYDYQYLAGVDNVPSSDGLRAQTHIQIGGCEAANSTANAFTSFGVYIWNYTNTNIFKSVSSLPSGLFGNVSADTDCIIRVQVGKWRSTSAITSIVVDQNTGPNFVTNSLAQLYGIL